MSEQNAPERIWRVGGQIHLASGARLTTPESHDFGLSVEYVRADLYDAQREELERLREAIGELLAAYDHKGHWISLAPAVRWLKGLQAAWPTNTAQEGDDEA